MSKVFIVQKDLESNIKMFKISDDTMISCLPRQGVPMPTNEGIVDCAIKSIAYVEKTCMTLILKESNTWEYNHGTFRDLMNLIISGGPPADLLGVSDFLLGANKGGDAIPKKMKDICVFAHKDNLNMLDARGTWQQYVDSNGEEQTSRLITINKGVLKPSTKYTAIFRPILASGTKSPITIKRYNTDIIKRIISQPEGGLEFNKNNIVEFVTTDTIEFGDSSEFMTKFVNVDYTDEQVKLDIVESSVYNSKYQDGYDSSDFDGFLLSVPDVDIWYNKYYAEYVFYKESERAWYKHVMFDDFGAMLLKPVDVKLKSSQSDILDRMAFALNHDLSDYDIEIKDGSGLKVYDLVRYSGLKACVYDDISTKGLKFVYPDGNEFIIKSNMAEVGFAYSVDDLANHGYNAVTVAISGSLYYHVDLQRKRKLSWEYLYKFLDRCRFFGIRVCFKFYEILTQWSEIDATEDEKYPRGGTAASDWRLTWRNPDAIAWHNALVKKFVDEFKDDPLVIGFSCFNEPQNLGLNTKDSTAMETFANEKKDMFAYINENAPNKIIFIEPPFVNDIDFTLPNMAMEQHYYSPHYFTHNFFYTVEQKDAKKIPYPSLDQPFFDGDTVPGTTNYSSEHDNTFNDSNYNENTTPALGEWVECGAQFQKIAQNGKNGKCRMSIKIYHPGANTKVYIDDITYTFYDKDKNPVRTVVQDIDDIVGFYNGYVNSNNAPVQVSSSDPFFTIVDGEGFDGTKAIVLTGMTEEKAAKFASKEWICAMMSGLDSSPYKGKLVFATNEGECYWSTSFKAKMTDPYRPEGTGWGDRTWMQVALTSNCVGWSGYFDENLLPSFGKYCIDKWHEYGVPIFLGECGSTQFASNGTLTIKEKASYNDYSIGGENFARDLVKTFIEKYGISMCYFAYNGSGFGLHSVGTHDQKGDSTYEDSINPDVLIKANIRYRSGAQFYDDMWKAVMNTFRTLDTNK